MLLIGSLLRAEEQRPQMLPTRDVDISYQITGPDQPTIVERRRWLASERLVRADGPDKSATIFDRNAREITVLNPANRTYLKLEGALRLPLDPGKGKALKRGGEFVVAGLHCVDWSWTEDVETHTVCLTADGVLLRLVVDGKTVMQARSVSYARQPAQLFQVPPGLHAGSCVGRRSGTQVFWQDMPLRCGFGCSFWGRSSRWRRRSISGCSSREEVGRSLLTTVASHGGDYG